MDQRDRQAAKEVEKGGGFLTRSPPSPPCHASRVPSHRDVRSAALSAMGARTTLYSPSVLPPLRLAPPRPEGGGGDEGGPPSSVVQWRRRVTPRTTRGPQRSTLNRSPPVPPPPAPRRPFSLRARGRTGHHLTVMPVHSQARGSPAARCGSQTQQGPVDACFFHGGREGEEWPAAVTVPPRAPLRFDGGVDILQALAREVVGWRGCTHLPPLLLATPPRVLHLVAVVLPLLSRAVMSRLSSTRRLPPLLSQHDGLVDGCSQQMSAPELPLLGTGQFPFLPARG